MLRIARPNISSPRFGLVALLALAALFVLPASGASAGAGKCPSDSKTLMLATGENTSGGYGCGYLDRQDYRSIGIADMQSWSSYPPAGYTYDFKCDHQSGDVGIVRTSLNSVPGAYVSYSATNTGTGTRHWGAGVIWSTGNPQDGTLPAAGIPPLGNTIAYTQNCGSSTAQIPSWVLYQTNLGDPTFPSGTTVAAGNPFSVNFTSGLAQQSFGLPDGQPMYLQTGVANGALTAQGCVTDVGSGTSCGGATQEGLKAAQGVAVSPDGKSVYVASTNDNAIASFTRDATGALTAQGCIADAGSTIGCAATQEGLAHANDVAVSADGKSVYVVSGTDDAIARFDRNPTTGALTPQGCIADAGRSIGCASTQEGLDNPFGVAVSADGKSVYVASYGDDAVVRFDRDTTTGALAGKGCIGDPAGQDQAACGVTQLGLLGAYGVTVSPDSKSVYVVSEYGSTIARFVRDPSTGALTGQGCIARAGSTLACAAQQLGLKGASRVAVSRDGKSVYVASQVDMAVVRFDRDTATGALTGQGCIADAGSTIGCAATQQGLQNAFGVAVSPDGKSVYVGSMFDNAVVRFDRSTAGALTPQGCIADAGSTIGCAATQDGLRAASAVAVSPDGKSVYAVGGADNAVVRFDRPTNAWSAVAQTTTLSDAGTLTWKPPAPGTYNMRIVYPGLNVASPNRGYTPALSSTFDVTATSASARAASRSVPRVSTPPPPAGAAGPDLARLLETRRASFGALTMVNSQFTVPRSGPIGSSLSELACPKGFALLHVEAASVGKGSPGDGVTVGRSSSGRVELKISNAARGRGAQAQLTCRRSTARRVVRHDGHAYGTIKGDRVVMTRRNRTVFGGLGADRLIVSGAGSSAFGGLGNDRIIVRAKRGNASGGPGDDSLRSTSTGLTLLVGGLGNDRLIGSRGPTLINALDGNGGDTILCHSDKNRVLSDPGDTVIGPCARVHLP